MILINKSKLPQIISIPSQAIPFTVYPGMVFQSPGNKYLCMEYFEEFNIEYFRDKRLIGFQRDYALGDLIQLIPVAREFKRHYNVKNIQIFTMFDYVKTLQNLFTDIIFSTSSSLISRHQCDVLKILNSILEKDHSVANPENQKHRVDIYAESLGIPVPLKCDWSSTHIFCPRIEMKNTLKKVGLQIRGSGCMKTLPYEYVKKIAETLSKKYQVVLIDQSKDKGFEGTNILNLCGKLSPYEVTGLLSKLDCCITMDSGVLWMAHVANCPTLTLLGPTREAERISLHPQYPLKAKAIDISKMVGCSPCFETRVRCKGRIKCMKDFDQQVLLNEIQTKLFEIIGE